MASAMPGSQACVLCDIAVPLRWQLRADQHAHMLSWQLWWVQMQALASGFGTVLGTVVRIPCEVLKQRLQVIF